jgi:hypothetical protein
VAGGYVRGERINERLPVGGASAGNLDVVDSDTVASAVRALTGGDTELGDESGVDATLLHGQSRDGDRKNDGGNESGRELHCWSKTGFKK